MRTLAVIGLGSNLAHPRRQLARAAEALALLPRSRLRGISPFYLTAPLGCAQPQPDYVNAVALVETALGPKPLLARLQAIERRQRRVRHHGDARNRPRTLDLDLLLYGRRRLATPNLSVPHPRMHQRHFVLRPLRDVAPTVTIPQLGLAQRWLRQVAAQPLRRTRSTIF
jgi:2-amino-4-hydroxy-6-hydroxymethyldihydropteridine diphosphokinase